nr:hypothetical protein [Tanacetum cinerariifolium]
MVKVGRVTSTSYYLEAKGGDGGALEVLGTSSRVSKPSQDPQFYYGFHIKEDKIGDSTLTELNECSNYKKAMASPKAAKWKEAMKSEI